jgi:FkbM family methyltransferase
VIVSALRKAEPDVGLDDQRVERSIRNEDNAAMDLKKVRNLLSATPIIYESLALLKLVWLRLTYSGSSEISAVTLVKHDRGVAVDVGANRGQSAIQIANLKPGFQIVAFEPNEHCRLPLRIVGRMLGNAFDLHLVGLSDSRGLMTYYEPRVGRIPVSAEGTFYRKNLGRNVAGRIGSNFQITQKVLRTEKLDDFNLAPDFIKIDVQGAELSVLIGAHNTIKTRRPILLIERNSSNEDQVISYLENLGYVLVAGRLIEDLGLLPQNFAGDNLFLPRSTVEVLVMTKRENFRRERDESQLQHDCDLASSGYSVTRFRQTGNYQGLCG